MDSDYLSIPVSVDLLLQQPSFQKGAFRGGPRFHQGGLCPGYHSDSQGDGVPQYMLHQTLCTQEQKEGKSRKKAGGLEPLTPL